MAAALHVRQFKQKIDGFLVIHKSRAVYQSGVMLHLLQTNAVTKWNVRADQFFIFYTHFVSD